MTQLDGRTRKVTDVTSSRTAVPTSGLQSVMETWEREVVAVAGYLLQSNDAQVKGAMRRLPQAGRYSYLEQARQILARHETDKELVLGEMSAKHLVAKLKHLQAGGGVGREELTWDTCQAGEGE